MSGVDGDKLNGLVGKMLGDLGGAFSVPTARIGFRLGLFAACTTTARRRRGARRTDRTDRAICARMGAGDQAANGYVVYRCGARAVQLDARTGDGFRGKGQPGLS